MNVLFCYESDIHILKLWRSERDWVKTVNCHYLLYIICLEMKESKDEGIGGNNREFPNSFSSFSLRKNVCRHERKWRQGANKNFKVGLGWKDKIFFYRSTIMVWVHMIVIQYNHIQFFINLFHYNKYFLSTIVNICCFQVISFLLPCIVNTWKMRS